MKKLNQLAAMLLAMVMVLGLAGTAFASEAGYADVSGHWAEEEIGRMVEMGLIDGVSGTAFAPDEIMTRGDLVLALYRLAGSPANAADAVNPFEDVDAKYKDAVIWATSQGIVNGVSPKRFDPDGSSQRQAIAKALNLFAAWKVKKEALTSSKDVLSGFPDAAKVEEWARAPMNWAVASEFITGSDGGRLDPAGTATRAQVAATLCRYLDDDTGDAAKDDPRNGDGIGENELLVVSFGTSFNDNRAATIKAVEDAMEAAFPEYAVRRGFTADIIIEHVFRRDGEKIDSVTEALDRAVRNGVKNLLVQPTHLMNGYEYGDLRDLLEKKYADKFETIKIGAPLLTSGEDFTQVALAMVNAAKDAAQDGKTAVCYMGHGTEAASNGIYARMQEELKAAGYDNYFIGTVESAPTAEDLVKLVKEGGYEKVVLRPMMIVAGDHANNDMADPDDPDSWYSVFSAAGLEVACQINGLGEIEEIQQLLVEHARNAELLSETKIEKEPNPANSGGREDGVPAPLADGVYTIEAVSDSKMFRVVACELTVKGGGMTAVLTLSGTGYKQMYAGTAEEAGKAEAGLIDFVEDAEGKYTFQVPVEALDRELSYAALGSKWFDRTLTFDSATAVAK